MESINVTLIYDYGYMIVGEECFACCVKEVSLTDYLMYGIFKNYPVDRLY